MLRVDYRDELDADYCIHDASLLDLLRLGRKIQSWLKETGLDDSVEIALVRWFSDGEADLVVHMDYLRLLNRHKKLDRAILTDIRNKMKEFCRCAEWGKMTKDLEKKIACMALGENSK